MAPLVADPIAGGTPAPQDEPLLITRSADLRNLSFPRLPGTAAEARAIQKPASVFAGGDPRVLLEQQATEAAAKAVRRPKVLVLSTHGFFLPAQPWLRDERTGEYKPNPQRENPLLRCGLALAGANNREKSTTGDDGILTGLEILAMDLRNTDLVVLSACETGIGQVANGEGVAGLRQCFQLAGAKSVLATLWKIPDAESTQLMTTFFTRLSEGVSRPDALRQAQLEMIKRLKDAGKAPHPYYWAAFTVTGE